jgi:hypothetical protein
MHIILYYKMSNIYGGISAGKVVAQNIYFGIDGSKG